MNFVWGKKIEELFLFDVFFSYVGRNKSVKYCVEKKTMLFASLFLTD